MEEKKQLETENKEMLLEQENRNTAANSEKPFDERNDEVIKSTFVPETMIEFDNTLPNQGIEKIVKNPYVESLKGTYITNEYTRDNKCDVSNNQFNAIRETEVAGQYGSTNSKLVTDHYSDKETTLRLLVKKLYKSYKIILCSISLICLIIVILLNRESLSDFFKTIRTGLLYCSLICVIAFLIIEIKDTIFNVITIKKKNDLENATSY